MKPMKRAEAVRLLGAILDQPSITAIPDKTDRHQGRRNGYESTKEPSHWGLVEFRHFLDVLYGGPPRTPEEELKR